MRAGDIGSALDGIRLRANGGLFLFDSLYRTAKIANFIIP